MSQTEQDHWRAEIEQANIVINDAIWKMNQAKHQKADAEVSKAKAELALHELSRS